MRFVVLSLLAGATMWFLVFSIAFVVAEIPIIAASISSGEFGAAAADSAWLAFVLWVLVQIGAIPAIGAFVASKWVDEE